MSTFKQSLKENIKVSFYFNDHDNVFPYTRVGINALFVMENDEVYASGCNSYGLVGFGHNNAINEPMIVNSLCNKGIIDFANGYKHVIAKTDKNQLYTWGYNEWGQLGNCTFNDCFVPQLVERLSDECIIDVRCGRWHSLALTECGQVYSWGSNINEQLGNGLLPSDGFGIVPLKIDKFNDQNIIAISCGAHHSLALTKTGRVYSWGDNDCWKLGHTIIIGPNKPKRIKMKNKNKFKIKGISCGLDYSLLLTSDGDIYGFGSNIFGQLANKCFDNHSIPTKIMTEHKFVEIASHYDHSLSAALSNDGIYYIWGKCGKQIITEPKATQFDSFNNIFLKYYQISYNRTQTNNEYGTDFLHLNYKINFQDFGLIASGNYGIVSKAKNNNDNEIYAIKRIALNHKNKDSFLKEFEIISQLNCDFVIEVKAFWIQENYLLTDGFEIFKDSGIESLSSHNVFDPRNDLLLHIQMELCFKSLEEIVKLMNIEMNYNNEGFMNQIYYYITSELLIEILECVDYLHNQNPPIIHRDLKPANILITHGINGRFIKLCDFGLAKLHEFDGQSHTTGVGSLKYMAPEVLRAQKYNTKADIYSLAVVIHEQIKDFKVQIEANPEMTFFKKYQNLLALVDLMMEEQELRLDCESILNQKNSWALNISEIQNDTLLEEMSNKSFIIEENFHSFFIKKKLEFSKQLKHPNF